MAQTNRPVLSGNFIVEIEGVSSGAFSEVSGLGVEVDVIEYRNGSDLITRKLPGRIRYENVVLSRGYTANHALWQWIRTVLDGGVQRRACSIVLLDERMQEITRWNLFEAWPCRWTLGDFDASDDEVLVEELEIAVEKIELG